MKELELEDRQYEIEKELNELAQISGNLAKHMSLIITIFIVSVG